MDKVCRWEEDGWMSDTDVMVNTCTNLCAKGVSIPHLHDDYMVLDQVRLPDGDDWDRGKISLRIHYSDEETNPLRWDTEGDLNGLTRHEFAIRELHGMRDRKFFQVVVGYDLVGKCEWIRQSEITESEVAADPVSRKIQWRTPNKLAHPLETKFRLANGAEMIFCYCPKGKFVMSNVPDQDKNSHRVELTQPFWITKYNVTAKERRDFGKYDCEGKVRELERLLPKKTICCAFNRWEWDAYCDYLTKRYRDRIPKGYVFRLPTEAEWEYAYMADCPNGIWGVNRERFLAESDSNKSVFAKILRKNKDLDRLVAASWWGQPLNGVVRGWQNVFIGGHCPENAWGICDVYLGTFAEQFCLDSYEINDGKDWGGGNLRENLSYSEVERNPVRWAGKFANRSMMRGGGAWWAEGRGRFACGFDSVYFAHIVIGPDILAPLKAAEKQPFPLEDFGGQRISDECKIGGFSSLDKERDRAGNRALLMSAEQVVERGDVRAFHTEREDSPWVQIDFPKEMRVTGLIIEGRNAWNEQNARLPLVVWISNDAKVWKEIHRENQIKKRYRIDLQKKSYRGRFLRVGREPMAKNDFFHLHKVLIYGK